MTEGTTDNVYKDALGGMINGISVAADAVRITIGAAGRNVIIEADEPPFNIITNDANSIIQAIELTDPLEKRGLSFLKEGATLMNNNSGDGRTTMTLILEKILIEGEVSGTSTLAIKKSLDELIPVIEASIDSQKKVIDVESVKDVATIAGESESLGDTLRDIYRVIGKDGIIHLEGSGTFSTSYSLIEGVRFNGTGYLSPYMAHDEEAHKAGRPETKAVYENPVVLVTKRKIQHLNDINPLLAQLTKEGKKDLVIFTDDMDSGVASLMIEAHKSHVFNILIIKAPVLWKNYVFEDFAKVTGSTIVEDASGVTFKNLEVGHLGTCGKIIVDREETTVIGIADISQHIADLKADNSNDSKLRLSWLQTKTAVLRLGANSESELSYLRLKAEDAIHASRLALADGVVAGGGLALSVVGSSLDENTIGGRIMREALKAPMLQIIANAGGEKQPIAAVSVEKALTFGFNAATGEWVDMFDAGIIDAALVVKNAVRNAIGIASTILTAPVVITIPAKSKEQMAAELMAQRRPY